MGPGYFLSMRRALTLALCLAGLQSQGVAQRFDPIETRNHRALSLSFLRLQPRITTLGQGRQAWSFGLAIANDLRSEKNADDETITEDYETARLSVGYRQGLSPTRELFVELPLLSRGPGFLDPVIDWWHRNVLHWTSALRDATPQNQCSIELPSGESFGSASGLGDLSVGMTQRLGPSSTFTIAAKAPTGNPDKLFGSGAFDLGASVQTTGAWGPKWGVGAQLGLVAQGKATRLPGSRSLVHQEALWLTYQANSRDAWIVQWQGEASALRLGIGGSDATHRLVTFGLRRAVSKTESFEAFFTEDKDLFNSRWPEGASIGPDFTIGVRWTVLR